MSPLPGFAARKAAAELLSGVVDSHQSLGDQLSARKWIQGPLEPSERARAQSLATLTLRHLDRIDGFLARFLTRVPPRPALNALRLSVAEVHLEGIPPHAAVNGAVSLARLHPKSRNLTGLVNAVARRSAQAGEQWAELPAPEGQDWLSKKITQVYGEITARRIFAVQRTEPPVDLTPRDAASAVELAAMLGGNLLPTGSIRLKNPERISSLRGFETGEWWVQDAAAALPARLLGTCADQRVLDICAAPGGKTLQLSAAGANVTALDVSDRRLVRLRENLRRTGLDARIVAADALEWSPAGPFDAILLDAPCSASGTLRRHPDLPHVRGPDEIPKLVSLQRRLLDRAWNWLAPGGRLVYCTCSLLPEEGEAQIAAFLEREPEARCLPPDPTALGIDPDWLGDEPGLRLRPDYWSDAGGMDGFYAAVLHKM